MKLPESVVEESGRAFIEAAAKQPAAWDAALGFMNYHSSLVTYTRVLPTVTVPPGASTNYELGPLVDKKPHPDLAEISAPVAASEAARIETIGKNLNSDKPYGPPQLFLNGGAISLDNKFLRHVV